MKKWAFLFFFYYFLYFILFRFETKIHANKKKESKNEFKWQFIILKYKFQMWKLQRTTKIKPTFNCDAFLVRFIWNYLENFFFNKLSIYRKFDMNISNEETLILNVTKLSQNLLNDINSNTSVPFGYELWQKVLFCMFMIPIILLSIAGNYQFSTWYNLKDTIFLLG